MNFNIYNILIIAGVIQGFIFTGIVFFNKKYRAKSTIFLVSLIFIYSLANLTYILPDIGVMSLVKMYNTLFFPFASIIPVLIYFYVIYFLNPTKKTHLREKLLFAPFLVFLILTLFFRFNYFIKSVDETINPLYVNVIHTNEIFSVLYSIVLLVILLFKIQSFRKKLKEYDRTIVHSDIKWLFITIATILFFTFYWAYLTYLNIFTTQSSDVSFYYLWIVIASLIYWLGHIGIYKYGILKQRKQIRQHIESSKSSSRDFEITKELKSKSSDQHIQLLKTLLSEEKIYLDPNLSLDTVSERLQLSSSYLSRLINNELNISFPDFLNSFRVEEVKSYLKNPEFSKYTILSIGLEAGFNSKSAFYDIFKKATGKTPSSYRKEQLN